MLALAAVFVRDNFDAALLPDDASLGGSMSIFAKRAWAGFARKYGFASHGYAVLAPKNATVPPLRSRRRHGFDKGRRQEQHVDGD